MWEEFEKRISGIGGIPPGSVQYRHIENPTAPYLVWYIENETIVPDDSGRVRTRTSECVIELCTIGKRRDIESEIEDIFSDFEIAKREDYDYAEDVYVVTFEVTAVTKERRK